MSNGICLFCRGLRDDWKREKMDKIVAEARAKAKELGEAVAIIKESTLEYQIVKQNETTGKNVIQYISSGN